MAHGALKKMWRYHLIRALRLAHRAGQLSFPKTSAFLADYPRFNALLRRLYEMVWYAHIGASLRDPRFTLRYIGRYTKRAVLAEYRITSYDPEQGLVRFAFRDYAKEGKTSYKTLPVLALALRSRAAPPPRPPEPGGARQAAGREAGELLQHQAVEVIEEAAAEDRGA